ncbi:hypothetical protein [Amycolatopsis sp. NPDC059021]|uniref:hypothetical protein n=1 Tax=Amycolatopsis sp. NPDC059021 TaxID=3346704 RepID=UPI00366FD402
MTHHDTPPPVTVGDFAEGPDMMLWNPDLPRARWHRERVRAFCSRSVVHAGLCGALVLILGLAAGDTVLTVTFIVLGTIVLCGGVVIGVVNLGYCASDHQHTGGPCHLEIPGEFFFRTKDFTDMGPATGRIAVRVMEAVAHLHTTPARGWLDPDLPRSAHRLAWQTLSSLETTRTTRALADQLAAEPGYGGLAETLEEAIAGIDHRLTAVAEQLTGCVVLTREWSRKLHDADLRDRVDRELAVLAGVAGKDLIVGSEALLQTTFTSVTAARDLTNAGSFPWERSRNDRYAAVGLMPFVCHRAT